VAATIRGLASGVKGKSDTPFSADISSTLEGLAKRIGSAGQAASSQKPPTLAVRQTPAPGNPESFAQAASIIGGLAQGLKGQTWIPFGADAASVFEGLAKGLRGAGQAASGKGLAARQAPAAGSPQSYAEAGAIISGLAQGLKGTSIPFADSASAALASIAKGLGSARV
jgi:hypothetical protein